MLMVKFEEGLVRRLLEGRGAESPRFRRIGGPDLRIISLFDQVRTA